jgi:VWFA-related protein
MPGLALAMLLLVQASAVAPGAEVRALTVSALDEKGGEVSGLVATDVALTENGVARDLVSFRPDQRPQTVAIVVDSSESLGSGYRLNLVDAVVGLVARLPEGARYALWTTGDRPTKILDYTDDRQAAGKALRLVAPRGGNYLLDAVAEASADLKKVAREGTRPVMVALTGTGTELSYRDKYRSTEDAAKGVELFLAAQIDGGETQGADFEMRTNLGYVLDHLAKATGGLYEITLSAQGADNALRKLSPVLRAGYRLAYATVSDLKRRKLAVSVARPGTKLLVPEGSVRETEPLREP